jgi:hypothetical protein
MSSGLVICSVCRREVHQDGNALTPGGTWTWRHCEDKSPRCDGASFVYPSKRSDIVGSFCEMDGAAPVGDGGARVKVNYRRHEIDCHRAPSLGGDVLVYYSIVRVSDGYECDSGFTSDITNVRTQIRQMKDRVDEELALPNPWEERKEADAIAAHNTEAALDLVEKEREYARGILKRLVMAYDAELDEEFDEAMATARAEIGFELASDADDVLDELKHQHHDAEDDDTCA